MDDAMKRQVKAFAMGRVGIGVVAILLPRLFLRSWLGKGANAPATRMLTRMVGARDVALGLGAVLAVDHGTPVRGWLEAATVADTGDLVATLLAFGHLPRRAAVGIAVASLGGAAYGRRLVAALPTTGGPAASTGGASAATVAGPAPAAGSADATGPLADSADATAPAAGSADATGPLADSAVESPGAAGPLDTDQVP